MLRPVIRAAAALEVSDRVVVLNHGRLVHEAATSLVVRSMVLARPELLTELYLSHGAEP